MMVERVLALLAFLLFAAFLGIIAFSVMRADLFVVCLIGLALVAYDIWGQLFRRRT
uniref:Uncharacterized protein n=1 Tax=uncultured bacterium HF130_12L15 TaxID=710815 RepID=E0XPP3_9BACT|nr:hypothetical protein [uncultured bacterium HF130_12L15]